METYTFLREVADSWVLLAMFGFLIGAYIWAFLPSQKQARVEASLIPFQDENDDVPRCQGTCDACSAKSAVEKLKEHSDV